MQDPIYRIFIQIFHRFVFSFLLFRHPSLKRFMLFFNFLVLLSILLKKLSRLVLIGSLFYFFFDRFNSYFASFNFCSFYVFFFYYYYYYYFFSFFLFFVLSFFFLSVFIVYYIIIINIYLILILSFCFCFLFFCFFFSIFSLIN